MKVVIVGGGKVGELLCADFSNTFEEVTLIDTNEQRVEKLVETYDINGLLGNGANYDNLVEASAGEADMFISVTTSDEINMISCIAAKQMGAKHTVARIRNPEYSKTKEFIKNSLGIDLMVNPEFEAAKQIVYMLRYPTATKVESFSANKFNILEVVIHQNSILKGVSLIDSKKIIDFPSLVCLVESNGKVFVPRGDYIFEVGDKVHITAANKDLKRFYKLLGNKDNLEKKITSSLIIGAGKIAHYLIEFFIKANIYTKVIEINKDNNIDILKSKSIEETKLEDILPVEEQEINIIDEEQDATNIIEQIYKAHFETQNKPDKDGIIVAKSVPVEKKEIKVEEKKPQTPEKVVMAVQTLIKGQEKTLISPEYIKETEKTEIFKKPEKEEKEEKVSLNPVKTITRKDLEAIYGQRKNEPGFYEAIDIVNEELEKDKK